MVVDRDQKVRRGPVCGAPRTGRSSSGPGPCQNPAGYRTDHPGYGHCIFHLGGTRNHTLAAERERVTSEAHSFGAPIRVDPGVALLQEVHRTAGHVAWLEQEVAKIGAGSGSGALMHLYQRERDHLVRVSKVCIDSGVAVRELRLAEQQGRLLAQVVLAVVDRLELPVPQRHRARELLACELRAVAGGASPD